MKSQKPKGTKRKDKRPARARAPFAARRNKLRKLRKHAAKHPNDAQSQSVLHREEEKR